MAEGKNKSANNFISDPETEEEILTDSEGEDVGDLEEPNLSGGVALVETTTKSSRGKPKMWLAAVDRKMMVFDRMMDRVTYWPNKPPDGG